MLAEKMLQFKLPAVNSVRIPAGKAQGFTPFCLFNKNNCSNIILQIIFQGK